MAKVRGVKLLVVMVLFSCAPFPAADTLPSTITDAAFWKMTSDFSEPGGQFDFEMYMSNERTFQTILPELLGGIAPGGVYLGVGPEQNFTYISALHPRIAFIIDIRRENMIEMLLYKALFELSPDRSEFISRLFSRKLAAGSGLNGQSDLDALFDAYTRAPVDPALLAANLAAIENRLVKTHGFQLTLQDEKTLEYILTAFFQGGPDASLTSYGTSYRQLMRETDSHGRNRNFLAGAANFDVVREMQMKNLIIPVVGDFAGPSAVRAVGRYLKERGAEVNVFYVSNVEEYIGSPTSVWTSYCRNLSALPLSSSATFIRFGRSGRGTFLGAITPFTKTCESQPGLIR